MLGSIIGFLPMCQMSILVCNGLPNVGYNKGLWIAILVIVVEYWVFVVQHWLILVTLIVSILLPPIYSCRCRMAAGLLQHTHSLW
jgi:hypothetical protein